MAVDVTLKCVRLFSTPLFTVHCLGVLRSFHVQGEQEHERAQLSWPCIYAGQQGTGPQFNIQWPNLVEVAIAFERLKSYQAWQAQAHEDFRSACLDSELSEHSF
jgi:hypothetical protein